MNIFATDIDPVICARQHCDVHVRKMIIETAQMLSTAHIVCDDNQVAYKKTHHNHPCSVWVRESSANYEWTFTLLKALVDEFEFRFGRMHLTQQHLSSLRAVPTMPKGRLTRFAMAMPDHLRSDDVHESYRELIREKMMDWSSRPRKMSTSFTRREVPSFLLDLSPRIYSPVLMKCTRRAAW